MQRYYLGVDWADQSHQLYVCDENGSKIKEQEVQHTLSELAELGRWLDESRQNAIELWAAIEKPHGRIVDFLLDHGVTVYPINPKALDRARDRFRMSPSKSDSFDARVLAEFLRTDHTHLRALEPDSIVAQELKLLTRDHQRLGRQKTRLINQIKITLKEYYPRVLEVFEDLQTQIAVDFLNTYPTPQALSKLTHRSWMRFATREHHLGEARAKELWDRLTQPQLAVPEHVVRAKAKLLLALAVQLQASIKAVDSYHEDIQSFFAAMPGAKLAKTLPGGKTGTTVATLGPSWAMLKVAGVLSDIFRPRPERSRSLRPVAKAAWSSFDPPVTSICARPCTGFLSTLLLAVSGRKSIIEINEPKGTTSIKRSELWEPSGSKLFS